MNTKKCKYCQEEISNKAKICPKCGKKQGLSLIAKIIIVLIVIIVIIAIASSGSSSDDKSSTSDTKETNETTDKNTEEVSKEKVLYDDNNLIVKVTDWEYHSILKYLEVSVYIENNSDEDLIFTINDNKVTISGYSLSTYFYETVSAGTKTNTSFSVHDFDDNGIGEDDLDTMSFKLNIYDSSTWKYVEKDYKVSYDF